MTALVLGIDSGLDGAFAWHYGGRILGQLAARQFLDPERRLDFGTIREWVQLMGAKLPDAPRAAFIEEPFAPKGRERGVMGSWRRFGQLESLLWTLGYEVVGVQAKTWQRELLDLARFEVRTERPCKPRLAEGWTLKATIAAGAFAWSLRNGGRVFIYNRQEGQKRADAIEGLSVTRDDCTVSVKTVVSHDTKAASIAYVREHFPDLNLVPPRARNPHDGLADAVCIAVWGSTQVKETP